MHKVTLSQLTCRDTEHEFSLVKLSHIGHSIRARLYEQSTTRYANC